MEKPKKTKKERAAIRHEQNQRLAQRKKEQGLQRVSLWVPKKALDDLNGLARVGIVLAEDGVDTSPCVIIMTLNDKIRMWRKSDKM